jgi:hypothetical protein
MLHSRQKKAVRLLFEAPEDRVAEELGIRMDTLRRWKGMREFRSAMKAMSLETRESAVRIISRCLVHTAARIHEAVAGGPDGPHSLKLDAKVMVDLLKASGSPAASFSDGDDGNGLADVLARIAADQEGSGDGV